MGFFRRYDSMPSLEELKRLGGVVVIDGSVDGGVQGVGTGTACLIGEFADMTYATFVDASGVVTSKYRPVEIFSSTDQETKLGPFDYTLGQWGRAMGNGYPELLHPFSRLVVVPINLCSSRGTHVYRELPTCKGNTDPNPIVTVQGAVVVASREFKSGSNRARLGGRVVFKDTPHYTSGTDGSVTNAAPATTLNFTSASGDFLTKGVKKGDVLVMGALGGTAGPIVNNAGTYRVNAVTSATVLVIEKMNGAAFALETSAVMPYRLHYNDVGHNGGELNITEAGAYRAPTRAMDATIVASTTCSPTVAPTAGTATAWDPLSGLKMVTIPVTGLVYLPNVQASNAANHADLDTEYGKALDALLADEEPTNEVNIVWSARKYDLIQARLKLHELAAKKQGRGRVCIVSPPLSDSSTATAPTTDTVLGSATVNGCSGAGVQRDQGVIYAWPGVQRPIDLLKNVSVATADGKTTTDGSIDVTLDSFVASALSKLAPERSIAQKGEPIKSVMASITALQRGVSGLTRTEYERFRAGGVVAVRKTNRYGFLFEDQVTTSLTPGETHINRRMFSFFVQDSLAQRFFDFEDEPLSIQIRDTMVSEANAFCEELLSSNNPGAARIAAYVVDSESGNTKELFAEGIFVITVHIQMTPIADVLVARVNVQEGAITVTVEGSLDAAA